MIDFLTSGSALIALLVLTILGVMIGIDNIRFIDVATDELDNKKKTNAINISVLMAFLLRFVLLLLVYWVLSLTSIFWDINLPFLRAEISGESLLLLIGGIFLIYKGTTEIHEEVEDKDYDIRKIKAERSNSFRKSIWKTSIINTVFAFDIVLLALGLMNRLDGNTSRVIILMAIALVLSLLIILFFKDKLLRTFKKHPSINILGLSFLILTGFAMLVEGAYLSHFHLFGSNVGAIPKNYINIVIIVSLIFMFLVVKLRKENVKGELTS